MTDGFDNIPENSNADDNIVDSEINQEVNDYTQMRQENDSYNEINQGENSESTRFVMMDTTPQMDQEDLKNKQIVEKEKIKFEKKRAKAAAKMERKAAKKSGSQPKKHGFMFKVVSLVVSAAVFGVVALGTMYFTGDALGVFKEDSKANSKKDVIVPSTVTSVPTVGETTKLQVSDSSDSTAKVMDVSDVVESVMPSIVAITSTQMVQSGYSDLYRYFFGYGNDNDSYKQQTGAGSGIIIGQNDTELLIVTNNHVVEGADSLQIQFIDDESVEAVIKGTDAELDLAVVAVKLSDIKASTLSKIKAATLGNSDELKVGEGTIAIGNALGYGQSVTTGVVSALNRKVAYENSQMTLIQTDAAINPGNSGGALLNTKGEVIGINAAKYSSSSVEGMGFAIPVSAVKDVIAELMNKETLTKVDEKDRGYLNIRGRDVTEELSQMYNAPTGVLVMEVLEGGAADKAGIEKSDVITKINGDKVSSMAELQSKLGYYESGKKITLTIEYLKDKRYVEKEVEVILGQEME